jgi:hypothetical protein
MRELNDGRATRKKGWEPYAPPRVRKSGFRRDPLRPWVATFMHSSYIVVLSRLQIKGVTLAHRIVNPVCWEYP